MSANPSPHDRPVTGRVHPLVPATIVGLLLLYVLAAWVIADDSYSDYILAVISGFALVVAAIPFALWQTWRRNRDRSTVPKDRESFADWASGEFETWQYRLKGAHAAIEMLIPIAAVAFGMTAFAMILHFAVPGAAW
jgi:hypothetical protein